MTGHRAVWSAHTGLSIPTGWHVHHLDGNSKNNSPENLVCVSPQVHWSIHLLQGDPVALSGKFVQGAVAAGKRNAALHFTSERQSRYGVLGPAAQLARGKHLSQNPVACSAAGKRAGELGRSGFQQAWIRALGHAAGGRSHSKQHLASIGKVGGRNSASGPNAFWKTGGLARAAVRSPNNVNKRKLRCAEHGVVGTIPGMKRYHPTCSLVEVADERV